MNTSMRYLCLALAACALLPALSAAETTTLNIQLNGSKVGENVYEQNADGTFSSTTDLAVSTVKVHSAITGKFENGRLAQYTCNTTGQGPDSVLTLDHGKFHVKAATVDKDVPLGLKNEPYFGNIHPMLTASLLKAVDFSKKTSQVFKCFVPDTGSFISTKVTPEEEKTVKAGHARLFDVQLPPLAIEFALDDAGQVVAMDVPMQKLRFIAQGWEGLYIDPLAAFPELSQATYKTKVELGVKMKTRDGATLVSDVIRPDAPGKFPAIFERTPYGRNAAVEGAFYAKRGYAFVCQDCRGRGDSTGEWDPLIHERKDGYDSVQWLSKQPWCDGNVGMIGGSYGGLVQWTAAVENPPALKCIVPQVSPPDSFLNLPYDNGVFFLYGAVWWSKVVAGKGADMSSLMKALPHPEKFSVLPLSKVNEAVLGHRVAFFDKWLQRTTTKGWVGYDYEGDLKRVHIPALHISGWWDGDEPGTMTNWQIMRSLGRTNQWLIYGAWGHIFNSTTKMADENFGPTSVIDLDSIYLRWFDTWLKHKSVGMEKIPHVRAFVTGANKWVESSDWPLKGSTKTTLYFGAEGPADGSLSHGTLAAAPVQKQTPSKYTFNPKDAEIGKAFKDPDPNGASFAVKIEKHTPGLLLFKSSPMPSATTISGPFMVNLSFSTSAYDTDFYASLVDVDEKGGMRALGQAGKIRCSYLQGFDKQVALKPGHIYQANFRLWDFAHQLKKGHRLGLMLRSTMFPVYARNLGTIDPIATATRMIVQHQAIYHDAKHPSTLTFQVQR